MVNLFWNKVIVNMKNHTIELLLKVLEIHRILELNYYLTQWIPDEQSKDLIKIHCIVLLMNKIKIQTYEK